MDDKFEELFTFLRINRIFLNRLWIVVNSLDISILLLSRKKTGMVRTILLGQDDRG